MANQHELQSQALAKARGGESTCNYRAITDGFLALGIAEGDIQPRDNVLTFNAWKALGRVVVKGQHGVRVTTFVPVVQKDADREDGKRRNMPRMTTVFHISQTKPLDRGVDL
jgi:N-terminal domain of anti-restriction factor ArdC